MPYYYLNIDANSKSIQIQETMFLSTISYFLVDLFINKNQIFKKYKIFGTSLIIYNFDKFYNI